jgi:glycosyltransferase involved in cell wall biosynthesis
LEIILLNDGSTDNSMRIIEDFAARDSRIQYHVQPNQGLSVARNQAMRYATGKYIYFMDSDDILDWTALQKCYLTCEEDDFVFFDAEPITSSEENENIPDYNRKKYINENVWKGIELLNYELDNHLFRTPVWICFVNRNFLNTFFKRFSPGIIHEDHPFAIQIYLYAERVRYIPESFFKRRIRTGSIMTRRFSMRNIEGYTTAFTEIRNLQQQHPEWTSVINKYLIKTLNDVIWAGHRMSFLEKIETACRFRRLSFSKYVTFRNWAVFWLKRE